VNDFNRFGKTYQVIVQADAPYPRRRRFDHSTEDPQQQGRDGSASER